MMQQMVVRKKRGAQSAGGRSRNRAAPNQGARGQDVGDPVLTTQWGLICLVLNIFLPGIGTIISSFACVQRKFKRCYSAQVIWGILQMVTFVIIVGWIFSIYSGIKLYKNSRDYDRHVREILAEEENDLHAPLVADQEAENPYPGI